VVEFIDDRRLGPAFRFFNRHRVVDEKGKLLGYKNLDELRKKLKPIMLRRTRALHALVNAVSGRLRRPRRGNIFRRFRHQAGRQPGPVSLLTTCGLIVRSSELFRACRKIVTKCSG